MKKLQGNLLRNCVLAVLVVLAVAVYAWCFDSKLDLNGDNATYITLARNLASGNGYSDLSYDGTYQPASQFPPGYPFLLSIFVRLGLDNLVAFKIINGVFLLLSLAIVFLLFRGLSDSFAFASLVTLLCLASPSLVRFATTVMSESGYMLFILLSLLALWQMSKGGRTYGPWFWIAALSAVASYYFRGLGLSVVFAVVVFFLFRKEWLRAGVSALFQFLLILPWSLRNRSLGIESRYLETVKVINPWRPDLDQVQDVGDLIGKAWTNLYDTTLNGFRCILFPGSFSSWNSSVVIPSVIIGFVIFAIVVYGLWQMKPLRFALLALLAATIAILLVWHSGNDYRYMVPYIPIVVAGFWYGLSTILKRLFRNFKPVYAIAPLAVLALLLSAIQLRVWHNLAESDYPESYLIYFDLAKGLEARNQDNESLSSVSICCRKPDLFHYFAPSFYCCNYPYTSDPDEMARYFLDKKVGIVVVDQFGYNSTGIYLVPTLQKMLDLITLVYQGEDKSMVLYFDLKKAAEIYADR